MKLTASSIASSLKRSGIPIYHLSKRGKLDGVKVTSLNGIVTFQYTVWSEVYGGGDTKRKEGEQQVISILETMGLTATEIKPRGNGTGLFRISFSSAN